MLKDIEIIRRKLKEEGYANKFISYEEFKSLYEPYKLEMKEQDFAEILGISYGNYNSMKGGRNRTKILKEEIKISEERKEEIIDNLKEEGYTNKFISYEELKNLYEPHKLEMKEQDFAEILGISIWNYYNMKSGRTRAKILKEEKKIPEERKEEIRERLKEQGYTNTKICYQEIKKIYEPYKLEMKEQDFAKILGISCCNYNNMKNKGTRAKILREEKTVTEKRKEEIIEKIKKQGYTNKFISYEKLKKLYEPYKLEMKEQDFAKILGISYLNYYNIMKNRGRKTKIRFNDEELNRIIYQLKLVSKEYKKEELEKLCKKYKITLDELLIEIFPNVNIETLLQKECIYIGDCSIPEDFLKKYSEKLLQMSKELSKKICKRYNFRRGDCREDIESETLLYIIEKKGDLVKNSESEEEALFVIRKYMSKTIKSKYIKRCNVRGTLSLKENIGSYGKRYNVVNTLGVEITVEDKTKKSAEKIVEDMKNCYEEGMENAETIMYVRKKYDLSRKELIKIIEKELSEKRKIVKTANGRVYLGEEYD